MKKTLPLIFSGTMAAGLLVAVTSAHAVKEYTEDGKSKAEGVYETFRKATKKNDEQTLILGGLRENFRKYSNRLRVPGIVSASALPEIATIIGPTNMSSSMRLGDTVYFRWAGSPGPREGDRYHTFTPAIVMQNLEDATDFQVRARPPMMKDIPADFRMAGFFYEASGTVRITRVRQGIAEGVIERLSGQVFIGDQLMPLLPVKQDVKPITGGIQLAAAVVCGSPSDRLSTATRSFIYINRGARDGIKEGRVFQAIETVKLDGAVAGPAPERSLGEAMVVHVTDSYSTAVITKQFEVIRIGSLLKSKQELSEIPDGVAFHDLVPGPEAPKPINAPEIPNVGDMSEHQDKTLPNPGFAAPKEPSLSELDALEKSMKMDGLTESEKLRLGTLSRQEKLDAPPTEDTGEDMAEPPQNSFGKPKAAEKKKAKKPSKVKNDEEELNLLMQQN